jgi:hypothetical protein
MTDVPEIDYGPLVELIGEWKGDKGIDIAPEPNGSETNPYFETITFSAIGDVNNAETQTLAVLHYRQIVQLKSSGNIFHDETGYWMWDAGDKTIMHSLCIPRAVTLLAGAKHNGQKNDEGNFVIDVSAKENSTDWQITQSPFMRDNARMIAFRHLLTVGNGKLSYKETTLVDIYGKTFEHTDENELVRQ